MQNARMEVATAREAHGACEEMTAEINQASERFHALTGWDLGNVIALPTPDRYSERYWTTHIDAGIFCRDPDDESIDPSIDAGSFEQAQDLMEQDVLRAIMSFEKRSNWRFISRDRHGLVTINPRQEPAQCRPRPSLPGKDPNAR